MPTPHRFGDVQTSITTATTNAATPHTRCKRIHQHDDRGNRQTVADDRERPRVPRVSFVDEAARWTAFDMVRPSREERTQAAGVTAPPQSAPECHRDKVAIDCHASCDPNLARGMIFGLF